MKTVFFFGWGHRGGEHLQVIPYTIQPYAKAKHVGDYMGMRGSIPLLSIGSARKSMEKLNGPK